MFCLIKASTNKIRGSSVNPKMQVKQCAKSGSYNNFNDLEEYRDKYLYPYILVKSGVACRQAS